MKTDVFLSKVFFTLYSQNGTILLIGLFIQGTVFLQLYDRHRF